MNILIDCKNLAHYSSGIAGYFKPLLQATIGYFQAYHFILTAPNEFDTSFIQKYQNWELQIIPQRKFGNKTVNILVYEMWTYPNAIKKIDAKLLISPYYDFIIPNNFKHKSIITVHDLCYWELESSYSTKVKIYHKLLLNLNIQKASKIITVSQTSLNKIKKIFGQKLYDKSVVVYNTFEFAKKGSLNFNKSDDSHKVLLYTGGFEQRKNVEMLFRVLSELKVEMKIKLLFTGNFKENQQLQEIIEKYDLHNEVELTGIVSSEKLQEYYKQCDTVINISLCEGFGRSNLEAIMYGKPLICSDIEVFRELVGEYAIYCDPCDIESIKNSIKESFEIDHKEFDEIDIQRFEFKTNKMKFIKTIEDVIDGK